MSYISCSKNSPDWRSDLFNCKIVKLKYMPKVTYFFPSFLPPFLSSFLACLLVSLFVCLLSFLLTYLLTCLLACLLAYLPAWLLACMLACFLTYFLVYFFPEIVDAFLLFFIVSHKFCVCHQLNAFKLQRIVYCNY